MEPITLAAFADAAGGRLVRAADLGAVVGPDVLIDSRQVTPGSVFVAFAGERVDGHDFVANAADAGAGVALVAREVDADLPQVIVEDPVAGLSRLARSSLMVRRWSWLHTLRRGARLIRTRLTSSREVGSSPGMRTR